MDPDFKDRMTRAADAQRRSNTRTFETRMKPDWPTRAQRRILKARGYRSRVRINWSDDEALMSQIPAGVLR
jgi:hypothetical protein